jgi:choline dehydrogenase-like flavoprotein
VAPKAKPERADICIIGAGASGATAAKVLTERGRRVVALERGPWRTRETFGGDELANVNRYNLWPDPLLNPRTVRTSQTEEPRVELFCPVPQMVGGGTVHWQGWLPRFTENDFRPRTVIGDLPGATLADWPIGYTDLEPYYSRIEWAFGVSGQAGTNRFEGPRSRDYPCPPLPMSRYAQKFHVGCAALGHNSFPTPQAALSRPFNGRPPTVISAFAQQHGDPTGARSSAVNVCVRDAVAPGRGEPVRGPTQSGLPVPAAARVPVRAEVPRRLRGAGLQLVPDAAGGAVPSVQRAPAYGHQRLRAAARRPDRDPVERAERLRARRTRDGPV